MRTELIKAIGLELADLRKTKGIQLVDLAKETGINKDTISKYENGNSSMKIYIIDTLISFYGENVANFFKKVYDRLQNKK